MVDCLAIDSFINEPGEAAPQRKLRKRGVIPVMRVHQSERCSPPGGGGFYATYA